MLHGTAHNFRTWLTTHSFLGNSFWSCIRWKMTEVSDTAPTPYTREEDSKVLAEDVKRKEERKKKKRKKEKKKKKKV